MFSLDVLRDRKFLMFSGMSLLAIIIAPELNMMNRFFNTVPLSRNQWLICIVAALAAPLVTEVRKLVLRRREAGGRSTTPAAEPAAA